MDGETARARLRRRTSGRPSTPRPAASVVLLRRGGKHGDRALEVLLLKRSEEAAFMPGVWVFPGGAVDPDDGEGEAGYRACAVRELAEEAGIELPADEELVLFSRWITPEVDLDPLRRLVLPRPRPRPHAAQGRRASRPSRPPGSSPPPRSRPQEAGEIVLAFPTLNQLRLAAALRAPPTRRSPPTAARTIEPILPKVDRRRATTRRTSSCPATPTTRPEAPQDA